VDERLSKVHWVQRRADELAWLAEATGMSAAEVDADLGMPDHWAEEATDGETDDYD